MRPNSRSTRRLARLGLLLALLPANVAALELEQDRYANQRVGLRFAVPHGWLLTRQTGYPALLATLTHPEHPHSEVTVAHSERAPTQEMAALVRANNQALRAVGVQIIASGAVSHLGRHVWRTRASWGSGEARRTVHQLYLAGTGRTVFIVTVSAPTIERVLADVDMLVESLELTP